MSPQVLEIVVWVIKVHVIFVGMTVVAALTTLAERKVSAWMQYRHGPNRVGPQGILQPLADGVKFIFKESLVPDGANKWMFRVAPALAAMPAMLTIAVIPFGPDVTLFGVTTPFSIVDLDIGIMYILAIGGLSVYGVIVGGWASNSKYSLLGGLRASAQMVSYELSLILSILAVVAISGSLDLREIVMQQKELGDWNICYQPLAFLLFLIAAFAETNRHPFDFAECEPELVSGFHTEYSAMRFALFALGEYCAMIVMSSVAVALWFGGFSVPFMPEAHWTIGIAAFCAKVTCFLFLFLWVRWTLPRFRFDQLMNLGWKVMLPIALANLFITGAVIAYAPQLKALWGGR
jgi:NADH-quinone oxidoreductase subunit H